MAARWTTLTLMVALSVGCSSHERGSSAGEVSPGGDASKARAKDAPDASSKFALVPKLELRPLADESDFALALAKGPLPPGVRARVQSIGRQHISDEAVFEADDLPVLQAWSREFADTKPPELRVGYERIEATQKPTLAKPMHQGWQLHFVHSGEGFVVRGAQGELVSSKYTGEPQVQVDLTPEDGKRFTDLSTRLVDHKIAIMFDERVLSAPLVNEPIPGGMFVISMGAAHQDGRQAQELVGKLAGIPASEVVLPPPPD